MSYYTVDIQCTFMCSWTCKICTKYTYLCTCRITY